MVKVILKYPDKRLLRETKQVDIKEATRGNETVKQLLKIMESKPKIQGFSAPQIGIAEKVIVMRYKKRVCVLINPIILRGIGKKKSNEGCLSVSGRYIVKRPRLTKVHYVDIDGKEYTEWMGWKKSRIVCHEIDHLEGLCINQTGKRWRGEWLMK